MIPAYFMGLKIKFFRKRLLDFFKSKEKNLLIDNVIKLSHIYRSKKINSIILLNYAPEVDKFLYWCQQLIAESLGKNGKGILPLVSTMPKDNHSLMQLYLDGPKNNFFTFFYVNEKNSSKIKNDKILSTHSYLKNKDFNQIIYAQKLATENVFFRKKIPFRSFEINLKDEKTLGELFSFFVLETILLARALKLNPYNQPSVELIKTETKKILI